MANHSIDYFRSRSIVDPDTGCWIWQGPRRRNAYGVATNKSGVTTSAHRVCYEAAHGVTLPRHLVVCHKCDNPPCVNPDHLFSGTHSDNMKDCAAKGRLKLTLAGANLPTMFGTDNAKAKMNPDKVVLIRASTDPIKAIARRFGIDPKTVRQIRNREIWKQVS